MRIQIINGPNLNLLGVREQSIYGHRNFESYFETLRSRYAPTEVNYFQSNSEGTLIDKLQEVGFCYNGIILNAGAYTHTSIALADAIAAINVPLVEVHISNIYTREAFRHRSLLAKHCKGVVIGFGLDSYRLALESFLVD